MTDEASGWSTAHVDAVLADNARLLARLAEVEATRAAAVDAVDERYRLETRIEEVEAERDTARTQYASEKIIHEDYRVRLVAAEARVEELETALREIVGLWDSCQPVKCAAAIVESRALLAPVPREENA